MKKFAKGCLITALSMLFTGVIILIICTFVGGTTLYSYAKNNLNWSDLFNGHVVISHNGETNMDFSNNHQTYSGNYENMQVASSLDIRNLDLEIAGGGCKISESSDEYFHIYSENASEFQYYIEDETLYLKGFDHISYDIHPDDYNYIYLEIPKDFVFEDIDLELGAGIIEADSFQASNLIEMKVGAGEVIVASLTANTFTAEIGAGNAEIENAVVKDSDIQIGLGNMTYSGLITGNLSAECGMGNLDLYLNDAYENHNYVVDLVMGNMTLHQKSFSAVACSDHIQNGASSTYDLECGMGNMTILFQ